MSKHLILAGETIVAVADAVEQDADGFTTADGRYPFNAGVTEAVGIDDADLPADFAIGRYRWSGFDFERLPEPYRAPTDEELSETDTTWS